jgi:hypothetical protein
MIILIFQFDYTNGNINASGKNRLISINSPASMTNHMVANTGAVDKYVLKSCIIYILLIFLLQYY